MRRASSETVSTGGELINEQALTTDRPHLKLVMGRVSLLCTKREGADMAPRACLLPLSMTLHLGHFRLPWIPSPGLLQALRASAMAVCAHARADRGAENAGLGCAPPSSAPVHYGAPSEAQRDACLQLQLHETQNYRSVHVEWTLAKSGAQKIQRIWIKSKRLS